jgi:hypothetical protein
MPVPNTFANATTSIPLSQLDANFATAITLGNTAIQLGNTVSTLNNMTLANVTISSGAVTVANVTVTGVGTFAAGSNTAPSITTAGDTNTGIYFPAADTIAFTEGGSEAMRIDSSRNVGIGTSSPQSRLHIVGASAAPLPTGGDGLHFGSFGGYSSIEFAGTTAGYIDFNKGDGTDFLGRILYDNNNNNFVFYTNGNNERMRISSAGNLLIGTTSETLGGVTNRLNVQIPSTSTRGLAIQNGGTGITTAITFVNSAGSPVGYINVTDSATSYITSSDYRLKSDVQPMTTGLATIASLKPATYKWNADNSYGEGFIAHELQSVIPQAVTGEKDAVNDDGSVKSQGVDYSKIVVHLVAAIQELSAKVAALEAKQ